MQHDLRTARTRNSDMIGQCDLKTGQRRRKAPRFYIIGCSSAERRANYEVENLDVLRAGAGAGALYPPEGRRGFPVYREKPQIVIGTRKKAYPLLLPLL